jgi:flagellar P-ring protein precursor FlgI
VLVGGVGASQGGSSVQVNHLAAGRIPAGATVERAVASSFPTAERVRLELAHGDFSTAAAVADAVNRRFGAGMASALDARVVEVRAPADGTERVRFMGDLENVEVALAQPPAKVVLNGRTGSIVMNRTVTLEPAAVAHGNLAVMISSQPVISQPAPISQGQTVVTEKTDIEVKQDGSKLVALTGGANLADVVRALNTLGANAQDLLAILQALKAAGSLRAEIEVI